MEFAGRSAAKTKSSVVFNPLYLLQLQRIEDPMKLIVSITAFTLLGVAPIAWGQEPADEAAAIRHRIDEYVAVYNQHDGQALANLWADDAVYLNRDSGESIQGRDAIAAMFDDMFQAGDADRLSVTVESIRLVTPDVAIEDGKAELAAADGKSVHSAYTAVHVKKDGAWYLTSVRETELPAAAEADAEQQQSHPLDQLAWMVGQWIDQDEQAAVRTTCDWAKNGHFLTSNFEVSIDGAVALEGTQVIGWDPATQTIRSWMFDSEGGFGEGVWSRDGNQWIVDARSTQADGSQAASTNVYTVLDDNTFTWRSADRRIDGRPQPDVEEVPVYRQ